MKHLVLVAAACLAAQVLVAETVVWHSMDGTVGTQSVYSQPSVNRADATKFPLTPGSIWSNTPIIGSDYGDSQKNARAPLFAAAFPARWEVYDPVSDVSFANGSAYRFVYASGNRTAGGFAYLENDAALHLTTFTVEAFVRFETDDPISYSAVAVYPAFMDANNADAWGLRFESPTLLKGRFAPPQEITGGTASGNVEVALSVPDVRDGLWHHVALTFDEATKTAKLYFDYKSCATKTLTFVPWYTDNEKCRLTIGASVETCHNLQGAIDEFRYSDVALEPAQFLRMRQVGAGNDPDVAFQYDFEESAWFGSADTVLNAVDGGSFIGTRVTKTLASSGNSSQSLSDDVPAAELRDAVTTAAAVANEASLYNTYEGSAGGSYVKIAGAPDLFATGSHTIECFFKGDGNINAWTPLIRRAGGSNVQMNLGFGGTSGYLSTTVLQRDGSAVTFSAGGSCNDGNWHHAAMVIDRDKQTLELYLDYMLVKSLELGQDLVTTTSEILIAGTSSATFKGWIDSVRVTKRALAASEFRTGFAAVTGQTLGWARFESDGQFDSDGAAEALKDGVVAAEAGGATPAVSAAAAASRTVSAGVGGASVADRAGLAMNGGSLSYAHSPLLAAFAGGTVTVEFFIKADEQPASTPILRCNEVSASSGDPVIALSTGASAERTQLRLQLRDIYDWSAQNYSNVIDFRLCDGRWHHVALSLYPFGNNETGLTLYCDGEPVINDTQRGRLAFGTGKANLWIGGGIAGRNGLTGCIDELRLSQGQLTAESFLQRGKRSLTLIFR